MDNMNEPTDNLSNNVGSHIVNQNENYSKETCLQAWEQYESIQKQGHNGKSFIVNKRVTFCEEVMSKESITSTRGREPLVKELEMKDHKTKKKKAKHIKNMLAINNNSSIEESVACSDYTQSTSVNKDPNKFNVCVSCQNKHDECYEVKYKDMCLHACYDYYLSLPSNIKPDNNEIHKVYHSAYLSQVRHDLLKKTNIYETNCGLFMPNCMLKGSYVEAFSFKGSTFSDTMCLKKNRMDNVQAYLDAKEMFENKYFDDEFNRKVNTDGNKY